MRELSITINKVAVYNEVAKITSYEGARSIPGGEEISYDRIFTSDGDMELLEQYWGLSCASLLDELKAFLSSSSGVSVLNGVDLRSNLSIKLSLPSACPVSLDKSIEVNLFGAIVYSILGRWYGIVKPDKVQDSLDRSSSYLKRATDSMYYKKRPTYKSPRA